ncbi:MAG: GNAT family N-acetyltransferase [Candidatus Binataceae bacterium]
MAAAANQPTVKHVFLRTDGVSLPEFKLNERFTWEFWRPSPASMMPRGLPLDRLKYASRYFVHYLHLYSNRDYGALVVRHQERLIHYSITSGRYWKTRFMGEDDIRIGHVWSDPEYRGERLASFAIVKIAATIGRPGRRFWYVVSEDNTAAIHAAEQAGMVSVARGMWHRPLGLRLLSSYQIDSP